MHSHFPRDSFHLYEGKTVKRLKLDPFIAEILVREWSIKNNLQHNGFLILPPDSFLIVCVMIYWFAFLNEIRYPESIFLFKRNFPVHAKNSPKSFPLLSPFISLCGDAFNYATYVYTLRSSGVRAKYSLSMSPSMRFLITTGLGRNRALSCWVTCQETTNQNVSFQRKPRCSCRQMINTCSPLPPEHCAASSFGISWCVRWPPRFHASCRRPLFVASPSALGPTHPV